MRQHERASCMFFPSMYTFINAFLWTVSVKAGQSELNEAMVTNEETNKQRKERTHHVTFLNLYIDVGYCIPMSSSGI